MSSVVKKVHKKQQIDGYQYEKTRKFFDRFVEDFPGEGLIYSGWQHIFCANIF
uniref:Uncharacterized protein n=1 Tax=Candidatus Kentrum sp. MB TaxID=2138164 RepID=A0A450XKL3_9GAMM|nr:MAG: hypothetical protein BECKMB1821G_GA0114241_10554 [Candidatus Kentron sp. MB]VFK33898.1 MAG: hypothetical protein BECKMB1821I_GA0114274_10564 [Candidatus Kentron sp. MB]VFK76502.1 MAG: hypothetical protein BECKMB1821H_GA0114242_10604 [Candidatus Kentron sp. MB]